LQGRVEEMTNMKLLLWSVGVPLVCLSPFTAQLDLPAANELDRVALREASTWVSDAPAADRQFDYVMSAKLRLLLFWVGKDDVGGGYIRMGERREPNRQELIQVLFGSDPAKAPRGINRWGAATEIVEPDPSSDQGVRSSAFFGFMKASEGESVAQMENELSSEQSHGRHLFQASLTRVEPDRAVSITIPFYSDEDFNLRQLPEAESMVMSRLGEEREPQRRLEGAAQSCRNTEGFLFTVKAMIDEALAGAESSENRCYVHNAHLYTATLVGTERIAEKNLDVSLAGGERIQSRYDNLLRVRIQVKNAETGELTPFDLFVPTSGKLRGVPVQIVHQPRWWFKVILTLKPASAV
jgi:hypothetical protein